MRPKIRLFRLFIFGGCFLLSKARVLEKRNFIKTATPEPVIVKSSQYSHSERYFHGPVIHIANNSSGPSKISSTVIYNSKVPSKRKFRRRRDSPDRAPRFYDLSTGMEGDSESEYEYDNLLETWLGGKHSDLDGMDLEPEDESNYYEEDDKDDYHLTGKLITLLSEIEESTKSIPESTTEYRYIIDEADIITTNTPEPELKKTLTKTNEDQVALPNIGSTEDVGKILDRKKYIILGGSPKFSDFLAPWW